MTSPPKAPSQADKFADLARELECDEDEAAFEEKVRQIAKKPPPGGSDDGSLD
jgi:hypothetical protein